MLTFLLTVLPKNYLSFITGFFAHIPLPYPFNRYLNLWFVKRYKINMSEAEHTIDEYNSIGALFTRNLKVGSRQIGEQPISPVDGTVRTISKINSDHLEQIKGKDYSLATLLADETEASNFIDGTIANFYLAPHNYHQIHAPYSGRVTKRVHIPGTLWPVNDWSLHSIENLFSINERVVIYFSTPKGKVAVILVGATNVGCISLSFDSLITNQRPWELKKVDTMLFDQTNSCTMKAGDKLGTFHLGSTVIVLFDKNYSIENLYPLDWIGKEVQFGQSSK
jgi:phosphatidylserine decarboxylase